MESLSKVKLHTVDRLTVCRNYRRASEKQSETSNNLGLVFFSPVEPVEALMTVRFLVLFLEGSLVELEKPNFVFELSRTISS